MEAISLQKECCYGSGGNEILVPKDEIFSESWMQWGRTESENMESLDDYFAPGRSLAWESDIGNSTSHLSDNSCGTSSSSQGIPHQNTVALQDQPIYQVDDVTEALGADFADDMILSSFLQEDLTSMESLHGSFGLSPEFQCSSPYDSLSNMVVDSLRVPNYSYGMKNSKYLKPDGFSQSGFGETTECSTPHYIPCNLGERQCCPVPEAPHIDIPFMLTQYGATGEQTSLEESVLHELEGVMAQLTQKTRICFRDSLYRLANISKQQDMVSGDNTNMFAAEKFPEAVLDQSSSSPENKMAVESKANVIDRTIANLMFNNTEINAVDLHPHNRTGISQPESIITSGFHVNSVAGDAEVPTISGEDHHAENNEWPVTKMGCKQSDKGNWWSN